MPVYGILEM